jgi:hypothetical protein
MFAFAAKILGACEIGFDRLHDVEPVTGARGLDERAAPTSEPGDRTVDHVVLKA